MKKLNIALVILITINGSGCSTENSRVQEAQTRIQSCCKGFENMQYQSMELEDEKRTKINITTQLYHFDEGKSFFKAYGIPEDAKSFTVKTFYDVEMMKTMFRPVVTFLDQNKNKTRIWRPSIKQSRKEEREVYGHYTVNTRPEERYVIVHTDDEALQDSYYHLHDPDAQYQERSCIGRGIDPSFAYAMGGVVGGIVNDIARGDCGGKGGVDIDHSAVGEIGIKMNAKSRENIQAARKNSNSK